MTQTTHTLFTTKISPDWQELVACIQRERTPGRVHYIELFLDAEVQTAVCERFHLLDGLDAGWRTCPCLQRAYGSKTQPI